MRIRLITIFVFVCLPLSAIAQQPSQDAMQQPNSPVSGTASPSSVSASNARPPSDSSAANAPRGTDIPMPPISMAPDRGDDSYAIYSLLMPGHVLADLGTEQNQKWLIADTTILRGQLNDQVPSPRRCVQPPAERTQDFQGVFEDFDRHKNERIQLDRNFTLQQPYDLLDEAQRTAFASTRTASASAPDPNVAADFRGAPGIVYFSQVYFNLGNTLALVYQQEWCGPKCGEGQWVVLEKISGGWVRRNWNSCMLAS